MLYERICVPAADGYQVPMDIFCPGAADPLVPDDERISVVICPGGGYHFLNNREAEPVALNFAAEGFNAFIVRYRVKPNSFPKPLHDLAAAVAYIRRNAERFHSHPDKIAVLGFSAGGHLAGSLSVLWHSAPVWEPLGLIPEQIRPNAAVLCYPVITAGEYAQRSSFVNLTGSEDEREHQKLSLETLVTDQTAPTFLWHTWTDEIVPVINSLLFAAALSRVDVEAEVHIFPQGLHGLALARSFTCSRECPQQDMDVCAGWPLMAQRFLRTVLI